MSFFSPYKSVVTKPIPYEVNQKCINNRTNKRFLFIYGFYFLDRTVSWQEAKQERERGDGIGTRTRDAQSAIALLLLAPTEQINCWENLNIPIVIGHLTCQQENPFLMISHCCCSVCSGVSTLVVSGCALAVSQGSVTVLASSWLASFSWLAAGCLLEWACGHGDGCGDIRSHSSLCPHQKQQQHQPETLCCMWEHRVCLQRVLHVLTSCLVYTEVWKLLKYYILYMIYTTDLYMIYTTDFFLLFLMVLKYSNIVKYHYNFKFLFILMYFKM